MLKNSTIIFDRIQCIIFKFNAFYFLFYMSVCIEWNILKRNKWIENGLKLSKFGKYDWPTNLISEFGQPERLKINEK